MVATHDAAPVELAAEPTRGTRSNARPRPGALRGSAVLTLQTVFAHDLVVGGRREAGRPHVTGLLEFAARLRVIWRGAQADDPIADWWLLKIDAAFTRAEQTLSDLKAALLQQLNASDGLMVSPAVSRQPVGVDLDFSTPYGFLGARLITHYDSAICLILTARHVGVVTRQVSDTLIARAGRPTRAVFATVLGYRETGFTRAQIAALTHDSALREQLSAIPPAVLDGSLRSPHAPLRLHPQSPSEITGVQEDTDSIAGLATASPAASSDLALGDASLLSARDGEIT